MKRIVLALLASCFISAPAMAQNAAQVSSAQNGANCPRCNLFQADFNNRTLKNRNFAGANLTNANFVGAYLERANFKGAILSGVNFSGAEMGSAIGLTQRQLDKTCGDEATELPRGLRIPVCVVH